jgi:dihydroxy-acid dehydratase
MDQVLTMILGGSTNAVLHLIAIAHSVGITLTIDDFQAVSDRTPFLADLRPSGKYVMEDIFKIGGIPSTSFAGPVFCFFPLPYRGGCLTSLLRVVGVLKYLLEKKLIDGSTLTVTGKTLAENLESAKPLPEGQDVIRPLENPIKATGHIR